MGSRTLARYFAGRFFVSVVAVFAGVFVLVLFVDYIDLMRRASDAPKAQASMLVVVSFSAYRRSWSGCSRSAC